MKNLLSFCLLILFQNVISASCLCTCKEFWVPCIVKPCLSQILCIFPMIKSSMQVFQSKVYTVDHNFQFVKKIQLWLVRITQSSPYNCVWLKLRPHTCTSQRLKICFRSWHDCQSFISFFIPAYAFTESPIYSGSESENEFLQVIRLKN